MSLKQTAHSLMRKLGVEVSIRHLNRFEQVGGDPIADIKFFLGDRTGLTLFDVGANVGQTIEIFRENFPGAYVHSFEPSPDTYRQLHANHGGASDVSTWNFGVGAANGTLPFLENSTSDMSSFLAPGADAWGAVARTTEVEVVTLDDFCEQRGIDSIDVLKCDTQGYELEVLKGARRLMEQRRIRLVFTEVNFADMYRGQAPFDELFRFLTDRHFALVAFYRFSFPQRLAGWTDALFIERDFHRQCVPASPTLPPP